jgi:hypothetical protein
MGIKIMIETIIVDLKKVVETNIMLCAAMAARSQAEMRKTVIRFHPRPIFRKEIIFSISFDLRFLLNVKNR